MAIQITRKEYEKMFGISPVLNAETFDTTPAPQRITRAEYDAMFRPESGAKQNSLKNAKDYLATEYGGSKDGIAMRLRDNVIESSKNIEKGISKDMGLKPGAFSTDKLKPKDNGGADILKGFGKAAFRTAGDVAGTIYAPIGAAVQAIPGVAQATDFIVEKGFNQKGGLIDTISDIPAFQRFAQERPNADKDFNRLMNLMLAKSERGAKIEPSTMLSRTGTQINQGVQSIQNARQARSVNKISNEILNIENSYNKTAIKNTLLKDEGKASRQRIANTDVLTRIVDEDGKITIQSAKDAANAYREQTIGGAENIVRDILKNEGKTVNVEQVRQMLVNEISSSGLQGADLVTAMNGIKKEVAGLKLRANEFGDVPLSTLHDAKISTTKNIDYTKPPEVSYRRSVANGYKKMVENVSEANVEVQGKSYGIKQINEKLGEYLGDIERIEMLGGKRVKGGRLGKYTAQISGNLAGAGVGGVVGGPIGMAIGTIVGGEVASKIRGKQMASTFGKAKGKVAPKSDVLEASKLKAKEGKVTDLRTPDAKVGAPKTIKKTTEILKVERQIAKNVVEQKKAIKAGNFTLVATLKEIHNALVDTLKGIIKRIKETPNQQGGFIENPFFNRSSKAGKPQGKGKGKSTYTTDIPRTKSASSELSTPTKFYYNKAVEKK